MYPGSGSRPTIVKITYSVLGLTPSLLPSMADNNTSDFTNNDHSGFPNTMMKYAAFPLDIVELKNTGHKSV
jgi:hypothetical protein